MIRMNVRLLLVSFFFLVLAGCGGGSGGSSSTAVQGAADSGPVAVFDTQVFGAWTAQDGSNEAYEFYAAPTEAPYTGLKTGRILKNGQIVSMFHWSILPNGSIRINKVARSCPDRPYDRCATTGQVTITAHGNSIFHARWQAEFDDNMDGVIDRKVSDVYDRQEIDLTNIAQGEFFLTRSENFATPLQGTVANHTLSVRMVDFGQPLNLSLNFPSGKGRSLEFASGEALALQGVVTLDVQGAAPTEFPVKRWYEHVELSRNATGGFILEYETHAKVQIPANLDRALVVLGTTETPEKKSRSLSVIDKFISTATIAAGDKFATAMQLDFNPQWVIDGVGNELQFTSALAGQVNHRDLNHDKYSETRPFNWSRLPDGSLALDFGQGIVISVRFVKPVNGGYQVLYTFPHPTLGVDYLVHDLIKESAPVLTENDVPGRYVFTSTDGLTQDEVTLHKDKTVTGIVSGFWRLESNGDLVSFECYDTANKLITRYEDCLASLDDLTKVHFVHVRRMRFMYKDGNNYQVKYDANLWGERPTDGFGGIFFPNYIGISWTYRWVRVGNE